MRNAAAHLPRESDFFLLRDDEAVAAGVALVHDAGLAGVRVRERVETVSEQVHLKDRLFRRHGLEREGLP